MPTIDDARKYIVKVNGGSGCLIRPLGGEDMYILTAKHVIDDHPAAQPFVIERYSEDQRGYIPVEFTELRIDGNYFPHPDKDAAILKIAMIADAEALMPQARDETCCDGYHLAGYPKIRRNGGGDSYRVDPLRLLDHKPNGLREARVDGNPTWEELVGMSGGGIFRHYNGHLLLAGVQSRIPSPGEQLGRLHFLPTAVFDEIVDRYPNSLRPLLPYHMSSFELLRDGAMELKEYPIQRDVAHARSYLRALTARIVERDLHPVKIKEKFGLQLLLAGSPASDLLVKKLWCCWLEFLIVLNVCNDHPIDHESLDICWQKVRLVFGNVQGDWTEHVDKLLTSDFKGLGNGGVVIVGTQERTNTFELSRSIVNDIARVAVDEPELDITSGTNLLSYRFIHLYAFQYEAIIRNADVYKEFVLGQHAELHARLREDFNPFIYGNDN